MPWAKEEAFRVLLHKIASKAIPERLAKAADLALENDEAAVKYVSGMILKELKQLKPQYKLRIFYAFSSIARSSVMKYGSRSKYVARWGVKLDTIAGLLTEIPSNDKILVGRVLQLWWRDGIFPPSALNKLQTQFPASPAPSTIKKKSHLQKSHRHHSSSISKSPSTSAAPVENPLRYWDEDLGAEVVITSNGRRDAPASPLRNDQPAQDPSPCEDSPEEPESQGAASNLHLVAYGADEDEDKLMDRVPKRRMITLNPNTKINV